MIVIGISHLSSEIETPKEAADVLRIRPFVVPVAGGVDRRGHRRPIRHSGVSWQDGHHLAVSRVTGSGARPCVSGLEDPPRLVGDDGALRLLRQ